MSPVDFLRLTNRVIPLRLILSWFLCNVSEDSTQLQCTEFSRTLIPVSVHKINHDKPCYLYFFGDRDKREIECERERERKKKERAKEREGEREGERVRVREREWERGKEVPWKMNSSFLYCSNDSPLSDGAQTKIELFWICTDIQVYSDFTTYKSLHNRCFFPEKHWVF